MIARELLIRLGFDIDESNLNKVSRVVDDVKNKMTGLEMPKIIGDAQRKIANFKQEIASKHAEFLRDDTDDVTWLMNKDELKSLKQLEKEAIKEVKQAEKQKHLEKQQQIKEEQRAKRLQLREEQKAEKQKSLERQRQLREEQRLETRNRFASWRSGMITASRKIAIAGAAIMGGFGLGLRSTLKDVDSYKKGENENGSTFTPKQIAEVDKFNASLKTTAAITREIRNSFVIDMLPAVNEVVLSFKQWMIVNKDLIGGKLKKAIETVTDVFKLLVPIISRIIGIFDMLVSATVGWKYLITAVIGIGLAVWFAGVASSIWATVIAFRAFAVAILANPLTLVITAIIAVLVLLIDEIYVTIEGGDSLINRFLKSDAWEFCKDRINEVVEALKFMWEWIIKAKDGLLSLPNKTWKLGVELKDNIKDFFDIEKRIKNMDLPAGHPPLGAKVFSMPSYSPEELATSPSIMHSTNLKKHHNNITQKNSFNMNITVPVGTSAEQAKVITDLVKRELEKHQEFETEKTLAAIGAY
jgi:hypothetical protein